MMNGNVKFRGTSAEALGRVICLDTNYKDETGKIYFECETTAMIVGRIKSTFQCIERHHTRVDLR